MRKMWKLVAFVMATCLASGGAALAIAKLDKDTCNQLRSEQANFVHAGILADIQRGPEWGKANLGADRIREIELFIRLDENLKFGCREATLTPEAMRAGEEALKIEANPDADPNAPPAAPAASGDAANATATPGLATGEAEPPTPAAKPRVRHRAAPRPKIKAADDAYTPPPASGTTLQAPAETTPHAPAAKSP